VIRGNIYGTYRIYIIIANWLLFFVFGIFFSTDRHLKKWCFFAIIASVSLEIALGFGQLFGWLPNNNDFFRLGGAFGNPGAYAGYLAVVSPLILSVLLLYRRNRKAENMFYFLTVCFVFSIFMLLFSRSRGAWLACGLGCLLVLNDRFSLFRKTLDVLHTPVRKFIAIVVLLTVASTGAHALYRFKADSTLGRVLVWKISASTPHGNRLWGNGTGYFEADYGKWQSDYFAASGGTESERYVADYVTCAYNEFLEIALEQGVVFLLAFAGLFIFAFRQKNREKSSLTSGAGASLAAIVVLMCVSYPLKITPIYLHLVFCLALLAVNTFKGVTYGGLPAKFALTGVSIAVVAAGWINLYGYHQLREGQKHVFSGQPKEGIIAYQKALPVLKNNGLFRFYYGSALAQVKEYEQSIEELEISIRKSSNPSSYILLGNNYQKMNQWKEAEQAYKTVVYMTPNRLYSKYLLAKLYMDMKEYGEAEKWAQDILRSKEKIPTTAAKEIKEEMKTLIQSITNLKVKT
jgi:tetratricopeptide (TPR) repeat protein